MGGEARKATNESLRLVGGGGGQHRGWEGKETHQRVIKTHWWWWRPASWVERKRDPPTSHKDSLVVVEAGVVGGKEERPTNES